MDDIFFHPESENKRPRGREDTGLSSPLLGPPPEISVTSDETTTPEVPSRPVNTPSGDNNCDVNNFEGFPPSSPKLEASPYDPSPFTPFWLFESSEQPILSAAPSEYESMDLGDLFQESSTPDLDDIVASADGEEEEEEEGEEDWSLASSEQFEMVSNHHRDDHSTPSDFVLASVGTPSIPDDLMSFSSDQDEDSANEDEESSEEDKDEDPVPFDQDNVSFFGDDENKDSIKSTFSGFDVFDGMWKMDDQQDSPAVRSKNLILGRLVRDDTLEEETSGLEHSISYDLNANEECSTPLGEPLLSSLVFGIDEARGGSEDIFRETEDDDEDMETPRAPSTDYIFNVTDLHSLCSDSPANPDMAARAGGSEGLYYPSAPQAETPGTNTSTENLQEESFFDSGNFQRVDDAYEYYPTKSQSRKGSRPITLVHHHDIWFKVSKRQPKRGKAKRKSKDRRRWKLFDQTPDFYPF